MPYSRRYSVRRRRGYTRRAVRGYGSYRRAPAKRRRVSRRAPVRRRRAAPRRSLGRSLFRAAKAVAPYLPYSNISVPLLNAVSSISGHGSYRTKGNSLISRWTDNGPPMVRNSTKEGGGFIVSNREYLGNINTGVGTPTVFSPVAYRINPADEETFPWLSAIARNFDQYQFKGLIFEYKSTCSDTVTSTSLNLGSVMLATEYNVLHGQYLSQRAMQNSMFASSGKPSSNIIHPIECARNETPVDKLYIKASNIASEGDPRLYDLALLTVATVGFPATASNVGELWVSYEVELFKPTIGSISSGPLPSTGDCVLYTNSYLTSSAFTSYAGNQIMGTSAGATGTPETSSIPGLGSLSPVSPRVTKTTYPYALIRPLYPELTWANTTPQYPFVYLLADDVTPSGIDTMYIPLDLDGDQHAYFVRLYCSNTGTIGITEYTVTLLNCTGINALTPTGSTVNYRVNTPIGTTVTSRNEVCMFLLSDAYSATKKYMTVRFESATMPTGVQPNMNLFVTQLY